jgi:hypothetical protein
MRNAGCRGKLKGNPESAGFRAFCNEIGLLSNARLRDISIDEKCRDQNAA